MVPHLVTALSGPINELEQRVLDSMSAIERWFRLEWMEHTPLFYAAVDVRNAGFKLSPVDIDLFPNAWNHLAPSMLPLAVQAAMAAIEKICPEARNLLIIPENDLRDTSYLSNLAQLRRIFLMAGLNVRFGSIDPELKKSEALTLPGGEALRMDPALRLKGRLGLKDFDPCTILLNNELGAGTPGILEDLHTQYLLPPLHAGWSTRRRSTYFKIYEEVAKRFGKLIGIDHWLINPLFDKCDDVDLSTPDGLEALTARADVLLARIKKKYKEYGIKEKPFVMIKADSLGRGAGLMTVRDARDVANWLAQANPAHADLWRGNRQFLLQEGVLTQERVDDSAAEPVVYLLDRYVVGGFYRVHAGRRVDEYLNTSDSRYVPLAFAESAQLPQPGVQPGASAPNRFYMYGVIARLAMLASSYELEATDPNAEQYS
jgi:glutamate--cysteine ligase